jgi:hypothetical protein
MNRLALITFSSAMAACFATVALTPNTAEACGGTFCDSGPNAMPVDQTGENVLFVITEEHVEAHIQIQYDPDAAADSFAWVIPVTALPEFKPGSQQLFANLLNGSVPTYGYDNQSDTCSNGGFFPGDNGNGVTGGSGTGDEGGQGDGDWEEEPDVVFEGTVGAFEVAVLDGGTVEGVMQWLGDNGYDQDPESEDILAEYLAEDFMFVAMKLTPGAAIDEIHPIALRYEGQEPCVPLRLTRIAAQDDMDVRVFFLGENRTVPVNYRHVLVNPLLIDWINFADNYKDVISLAVDAESADGNAFVTEYAGVSDVVSQAGLFDARWDKAPFEQLVDSPVGAYDALLNQGLMDCSYGECEWNHALIEGVVKQFIPVPDSVDETLFYECLECYEQSIDLEAWDAQGFADALEERIILPGAHALDLLEDNSYLTRMYTTISPNEMYTDPIFREHPSLDTVSNSRQGTLVRHCNDTATMTLPDGREVFLPDPSVWPDFGEPMPPEEKISEAMLAGAPLMLVDNTEEIDALLAEYNDQFIGDETEAGCGCNAPPSRAGAAFGFGLFCLAGVSLRRRRRQS